MFSRKSGLPIGCVLLCALQLTACKEQKATLKDEKPGPMKTDEQGVRRFVSEEAAKKWARPADIPAASCAEWATQSSPQDQDPKAKCKVLGGDNLCYRITGSGTYDIGPVVGEAKVGQPITVHFRVRNFGSGDYVIYSFGKVDWGDGLQQDVVPFGVDVALTHTYSYGRLYIVNAMAGAQFKYQSGPTSGSYEGCVDNSLSMTIAP